MYELIRVVYELSRISALSLVWGLTIFLLIEVQKKIVFAMCTRINFKSTKGPAHNEYRGK